MREETCMSRTRRAKEIDLHEAAIPLLDEIELETTAAAKKNQQSNLPWEHKESTTEGSYIPPTAYSSSITSATPFTPATSVRSSSRSTSKTIGMKFEPLIPTPTIKRTPETPEELKLVKKYISSIITKCDYLRPTKHRTMCCIRLDLYTSAQILYQKVNHCQNIADIRRALARYLKSNDISSLSFGAMLLKELIPALRGYWKAAQVPSGEWQWNVSAVREWVGNRTSLELAQKLFLDVALPRPSPNDVASTTKLSSLKTAH